MTPDPNKDRYRFELRPGQDIWDVAKEIVEMDRELREFPERFDPQEEAFSTATENTAWYCPRGCQVYFGKEPFDDCGACGTSFTRNSESYNRAMDAWEAQQIHDFERRSRQP